MSEYFRLLAKASDPAAGPRHRPLATISLLVLILAPTIVSVGCSVSTASLPELPPVRILILNPNTNLAIAYQYSPYLPSQKLTTVGGIPPLSSCTVVAGTFPAGLTLRVNPAKTDECEILTTGANVVTQAPGTYRFTVRAADSGAPLTDTEDYTIVVQPGFLINAFTLENGTVNRAFTKTITTNLDALHGVPPLQADPNGCTATGLPPGLQINVAGNQKDCIISGNPTTAGTYSVTITAKDSAPTPNVRTSPATTLVINPALVMNAFTLANGTQGRAFGPVTVTTTGGQTPITCSHGGTLPAGMTVAADGTGRNCLVDGTPTTSGGPFNVTITATSANTPTTTGGTASQSANLTLNPPLDITSLTLANGTVNRAFSQSLTFAGGQTPFTWSNPGGGAGTLNTGNPACAGLTMNAAGLVSGTPTAAGTCTFTAKIDDTATSTTAAGSDTDTVTILINDVLTLSAFTLANGTEGRVFGPVNIPFTGGQTSFTCSGTGLPAGLSVPAAPVGGACQITGTPTANGTGFTVQVTVTDTATASTGNGTSQKSASLDVNPPLTITTASPLPATVVGATPAYSQALANSGGQTPYIWSYVAVAPACAGLGVDGTGVVSGTPTTAGTCTFTAQVDDTLTATTAAGSATKIFSITVDKADTTTTITSDTPDPTVAGQSYAVSFTVTVNAPGSGTPTLNVTVTDGTDSCIGAVAAGGCTLTSTTAGAKTLTATYAGDSNYNGSTSLGEPHTVNKTNTTTAITADAPDPSVTGQGYLVSFTVTADGPGAGTPTGNVTVSDGTGATCTDTAAVGSCTLTSTTAGAKTLTATYTPGDANFNPSPASAGVAHQVDKADTATGVVSSVNPSVFGQSVNFTATVSAAAPGAGTPTGNVEFFDGVTSLGVVALSGGSAQLATSALSVTAHSITVVYAGDANFNGGTSPILTQTVNKASTTTTVALAAGSNNPSVFGEPVTWIATVAAVSPGAGTPSGGTVQFKFNGADFGAAKSLVGGVATSDALTMSVGSQTITAVYSGETSFNGSTSSGFTQNVNKANTTAAITSDTPDPSVTGQGYTVTFTVTPVGPGSGTPTGNVTVSDGTGATCTDTVAVGSCTLTSTTAGAKTLTATYTPGDANFNASPASAGAPHTVNKANTTAAITADTPDPSVTGQGYLVSFTVTADGPGAGTPTGNVTVTDGTDNCTGTVAAGSCTLTSTTAGAKTLTATYTPGDANFNPSPASAGVAHQVDKADTNTGVVSSVNPSVSGQSVTFTATVSAAAPGAGTPTGNVEFFDGVTSLGVVALSGGSADLATSALSVAAHSITAVYAGDADFNGGTSPILTQTVNNTFTIVAFNFGTGVDSRAYTQEISTAGGTGKLKGGATGCQITSVTPNTPALGFTATENSPSDGKCTITSAALPSNAAASGPYSIVIQVRDTGGGGGATATITRSLTVNPILAFQAFTLGAGTVGQTFNQSFGTVNGNQPLTACIVTAAKDKDNNDVTIGGSGTTLLGLTVGFSGSNCTITGTPSAGTDTLSPYSITLRATDTAISSGGTTVPTGNATSSAKSLTIFPAFSVNTFSLGNGTAGENFSFTVNTTGGNTSVNLASCVLSGEPGGMTVAVSGRNCLLSGPLNAGTEGDYTVQVTANDAATASTSPTDNKSAALHVNLALQFDTPGPALAKAVEGRAYSLTVTTSGGETLRTASTTTSSGCTDFTLADSTGNLSVTSAGPGVGTGGTTCSFTAKVDATDTTTTTGVNKTKPYTIDIQAPLALVVPTVVNGLVGSAYNSGPGITFSATGGLTPYQFSIQAGGDFTCAAGTCTGNAATFCQGFSLNQATGVLTGTPVNAGTCTFTAQVDDDAGDLNPAVASDTQSSGALNIVVLNTFAYVAGPGGGGTAGADTVEVINTTTNTLVASIDLAVGDAPHSVAVTPDGTKAYVTLNGAGGIAVVDTATNALTGASPIDVNDGATANCATPTGIAIANVPTVGNRAYVACGTGEVVIVDTDTDTVTTSITVGSGGAALQGVAFSPDGTRVYITDSTNNELVVIDTATEAEILVGSPVALGGTRVNPGGVVVVANGVKIYAYIAKENPGAGTQGAVEVIDVTGDTFTAVTLLDTGADTEPDSLAVSPDGQRVYVTLNESGQFAVLDNTKVTPLTPTISATVGANEASIVSAVRALFVVTITTTTPHGFLVGQSVVVSGVADPTFNGTWVIAGAAPTTFTYAQGLGAAASGGGTAFVNAAPTGVTLPPSAGRAYISLFSGLGVAVQNDVTPFGVAAPKISLTGTVTPRGIAHIPVPK
jgi:sugar lactone lactonase YvrE